MAIKVSVLTSAQGGSSVNYEEVTTTLTILGTQEWEVPAGVHFIKFWMIGPGENGQNAVYNGSGVGSGTGGKGGNGGMIVSEDSVGVNKGDILNLTVDATTTSITGELLEYVATKGGGTIGGAGGYKSYGTNGSANGNPGQDGGYIFDDPTIDGIIYGSSGGGAGAGYNASGSGAVGGINAGSGGNGGNSGGAATSYGSGGGGGAIRGGVGPTNGVGGAGLQGFIRLIYTQKILIE